MTYRRVNTTISNITAIVEHKGSGSPRIDESGIQECILSKKQKSAKREKVDMTIQRSKRYASL